MLLLWDKRAPVLPLLPRYTRAPLLSPRLPKQNGVFGFCFGVATLTCDRTNERKNEG